MAKMMIAQLCYFNDGCWIRVTKSARLFFRRLPGWRRCSSSTWCPKSTSQPTRPPSTSRCTKCSQHIPLKSWPLQTNIYCLARYEMCCDMVDVMLDVSSIYGYPNENDSNGAIGENIAVLPPACTVNSHSTFTRFPSLHLFPCV